ncbi:hypothetical protein [Amycolatopsis sp. NPDC059657]|uniref:hypothetical protein n=1 Tax=Amycolatopsis sp. NPDC059657 TaxID=3346899 RepID=UPI00366DB2D8
MPKHVNAAVLHPLKEALRLTYWYKNDLRAFLNATLGDRSLVAELDWTAYKHQIVTQLIDKLAANQHKYFDVLLNLLLTVAEVEDPSHLKRLTDGQKKYDEAVNSLTSLRKQVEPYRKLRSEKEDAARRLEAELARNENARAMSEKLAELKQLFFTIMSQDPQTRGYSLEKLLNDLFALYDIDAKGSFRIHGEQIDGAFTFQGVEYLLEAKWQKELTPLADLDTFSSKVNRKLDNTLGLFLSMSGFQPNALTLIGHSRRPTLLLMDGSDLTMTLEERILFPDLLMRKRQHAAQTGDIFLKATSLLT